LVPVSAPPAPVRLNVAKETHSGLISSCMARTAPAATSNPASRAGLRSGPAAYTRSAPKVRPIHERQVVTPPPSTAPQSEGTSACGVGAPWSTRRVRFCRTATTLGLATPSRTPFPDGSGAIGEDNQGSSTGLKRYSRASLVIPAGRIAVDLEAGVERANERRLLGLSDVRLLWPRPVRLRGPGVEDQLGDGRVDPRQAGFRETRLGPQLGREHGVAAGYGCPAADQDPSPGKGGSTSGRTGWGRGRGSGGTGDVATGWARRAVTAPRPPRAAASAPAVGVRDPGGAGPECDGLEQPVTPRRTAVRPASSTLGPTRAHKKLGTGCPPRRCMTEGQHGPIRLKGR